MLLPQQYYSSATASVVIGKQWNDSLLPLTLDLDRKRSHHQTRVPMATLTQAHQPVFLTSLTLLHCLIRNSEHWVLKCRTFRSQIPIPKSVQNKDGKMHMRILRPLNLFYHRTLQFPPTKLTFLLLMHPFLRPTAPTQPTPIRYLHMRHHDPHQRILLRLSKYHRSVLRQLRRLSPHRLCLVLQQSRKASHHKV